MMLEYLLIIMFISQALMLARYIDFRVTVTRELNQLKKNSRADFDVAFEGLHDTRKLVNKMMGKLDRALQKATISEKFCQRAFAMASQANVTMASIANLLQQRSAPLNSFDLAKNEEIKRKLKDVFGESELEYIAPLLDDEELEILDSIMDKRRKATQ